MRSLALLLTLSLALAGCIGGKDAAEDEEIEAQSTDDASSDPAPTTPSGPTPTTKPSSRPGAPPTPPTPPKPPTPPSPPMGPGMPQNGTAPGMVVVEGDAGAALVVNAPGAGATGALVGFANLDIPQAAPRIATLAATWEAKTPLDASMDVELFDTDGNVIATASGMGPLVVEIPGEAFGASTELRGSAFPMSPGAGVEYTVHFVLTLLYA